MQRKTNIQLAEMFAKRCYKRRTIKSKGTRNTYQQSFKQFFEWCEKKDIDRRHPTVDHANEYLRERSQLVGQKAVDKDRQAIQKFLQNQKILASDQRLDASIKSSQEQKLESRAYSPLEAQLVIQALSERDALSVQIACEAGLRAHELLSIARPTEQPADIREHRVNHLKFRGDSIVYTVIGKGGLKREVALPEKLAQRLEERRIDRIVKRVDRKIGYDMRYDLSGGNALSKAFTKASIEAVGYSSGLHGMRHTYAQERERELLAQHNEKTAHLVVSRELGHFRDDIVDAYLR